MTTTTSEIWRLQALPAEIAVWWEDRIVAENIPDEAEDADARQSAERRRVRMVGQVRLQTARALAGYMTEIAAFLVNSTLELGQPVLPAQFPSGVGSYVNYPLAPHVPVQMHVVTKLPDGGGGTLSGAIDYMALGQARLVLDWFAPLHQQNREFFTATAIEAVRTTMWIANTRRVLEMDPLQGTVIGSEGWPEPLPRGYRVPPLGNPSTG
jgi:hypothetical protein